MTQQQRFCGPSPIWAAVLEDSAESLDIRWLKKGFDGGDSTTGSMISSVSESPQLCSVARRKDRARSETLSLSYCALFYQEEASRLADGEAAIVYRDFEHRQRIRTQQCRADAPPRYWSSPSPSPSGSASSRGAPFLVPLEATDPPSSSYSGSEGGSGFSVDEEEVVPQTKRARLSVRLTRAAVRGAKRLTSPRSGAVGERSASETSSPRERLTRLGRSVSDRFMRRERPAVDNAVAPRSRTPRGL